jgi:O-antigen/teichoic acid export membrane protein
VIEPLNFVPSAVAAGAMPALTREALGGGEAVRRRTAATTAMLATAAAAGLVAVAPPLVSFLFPDDRPSPLPLQVLACALVPFFMNTLLTHALIAAGRPDRVPRLTAARIVFALLAAGLLVPPAGALGAACGYVVAETFLLALGVRACASSGFPVPVLGPLLRALPLAAPILLVVPFAPGGLAGGVAAGVALYVTAVALAWRIAPGLLRDVVPQVHTRHLR